MLGAHTAVHRVCVAEIIRVCDATTGDGLIDERREFGAQGRDHLVCGRQLQPFVVVALIVAAPEALPVLMDDLSNRFARRLRPSTIVEWRKRGSRGR